jgi:N-acetylmuramoyl-L-alanine amidase
MDKQSAIIILGTAHRMREPGKESPDKRLKECVYSREICKEVAAKLRSYGCKVDIDYEPLDLPKTMQSPVVRQERNNELSMRVNYVNEICRQKGAKNVLYVSIHVNAIGTDGKWHDAKGWQVCVSDKASDSSRKLADCLFDAAKQNGLKMRQPTATQKYWPQSLFVLNNTKCPAILTENLFQDNRADVDYLLSDAGRHAIARLHVDGILRYIENKG